MMLVFQVLMVLGSWLVPRVSAQDQTAKWTGAAGDWAPCPPQGMAFWDTCQQNPPVYPNGNWNAELQGGPVTLGGLDDISIVNLTIDPGYSLVFDIGSLHVTGDTIANDGTMSMADGSILFIDGGQVTLRGVGSLTMQTPDVSVRGSGGEFVNLQTIQGQGAIGEGLIVITNEASINANGGTLTIQPSSLGATNIGTMEAFPGSTLVLEAGVPLKYDNTGGIIKASDGGVVSLGGATFAGGTFMTLGSGIISASPGGSNPTVDRITLIGNFVIPPGAQATLQDAITNSGQVQLKGQMSISGNVTLQGKGTVPMSSGLMQSANGTDTLLNQQLIHGSGTIQNLTISNQGIISGDSKTAPLTIIGNSSVPTTNTSILEAINGGSLILQNIVNNQGGTIQAYNGSTVTLSGTVRGGTLTSSGSGTVQSQNGTLDGTVNIPTNAGVLDVSAFDLFLQGTINNAGFIAMSGTGCIVLNQPTVLEGSGKLMMGSSNCIIGSGNAFNNQSTIVGAGTIGASSPMPITNDGTIAANQTNPLLVVPDPNGFTNNGKLMVNPGSTMEINGPFNNVNAGMLSGGTYAITGTLGILTSIAANAANITLSGASAEILDTATDTNALATLTSNSVKGVLSLQSGQLLTTAANLSNSGLLTVGVNSGLSLGGTFNQARGTTTVDGTLMAPKGINLKGGVLLGGGTLAGPVGLSGALGVGDSPTKPTKLAVTGSYQQSATGNLYVGIGGLQVGSQYSQLAVSNGANIEGTLNVRLVNSFMPAIGDNFTILTSSVLTGTFSTVHGLGINSGEHFDVNYSGTAVTLTVASGP